MEQAAAFPWERLGTVGILGLIVYGAVVELWVSGRTHRRIVAEKDAAIARLEVRLDRALSLSRRTVEIAEKDAK